MVQRFHFNDEYSGYHKNGNFVAYTDYAALEAERDELAARLRAVEAEWKTTTKNLLPTDELGRECCYAMSRLFDGPVPECRGCAEKDTEMGGLRDKVMSEIKHRGSGSLSSGLLKDFLDTLARHATDEGGRHE